MRNRIAFSQKIAFFKLISPVTSLRAKRTSDYQAVGGGTQLASQVVTLIAVKGQYEGNREDCNNLQVQLTS